MAGVARIILGVLVTPADVMENLPFLDLLWRVCFRWRIRPDQVTGDTTYGTIENILAVEDQHVRASVPLPDFDQRTPRDSPMIPTVTNTAVPKITSSDAGKRSTPRASWSTEPRPQSARPAP